MCSNDRKHPLGKQVALESSQDFLSQSFGIGQVGQIVGSKEFATIARWGFDASLELCRRRLHDSPTEVKRLHVPDIAHGETVAMFGLKIGARALINSSPYPALACPHCSNSTTVKGIAEW